MELPRPEHLCIIVAFGINREWDPDWSIQLFPSYMTRRNGQISNSFEVEKIMRTLLACAVVILHISLTGCATVGGDVSPEETVGIFNDGGPLSLKTEKGDFAIDRGQIPLLYKGNIFNKEYLTFLQKVFPDGIPKHPIDVDRQPYLYRFCVALYEQRQYDGVLSCLDAVNASVAAYGDPKPVGVKMVSFSLKPVGMRLQFRGGEYPLRAREPLLRSLVNMELGDFSHAAIFADSALMHWEALDFSSLPPPLAIPGVFGQDPGHLAMTACEFSPVIGPHTCGARTDFGYIDVMASLAVAFSLNNESEKAQKLISQLELLADSTALKISSKQAMARVRAALSRIYMARRDYSLALKHADSDDHLAADIFNVGFFLLNLRYGGSSGLDGVWRTLQNQHTAQTKFQISHARIEVGRLTEAKTDLDEILSQEEVRSLPGIYWAALYDRGRIAEYDGSLSTAIEFYQRSIEEIERQRSTINSEGAKIGFFSNKQDVYQALVRALFNSGRIEESFLIGERSKSRALVDMLASKQDFRISSPQADVVKQLLGKSQINEVSLIQDTTLDHEIMAQATRKLQDKPDVKSADVMALMDELRDIKGNAKTQLAQQAPELASLVSVPLIKLAEIQQALPADETLLSYYSDSQNLYAFLIDKAGFKAIRLDREKLEERIEAFRRAIEDRSEKYWDIAKTLHDQLIGPLLPQLSKQKLLIAGHGKLHYLPFAALHDGQGFLIDRFQLTYLPSASTLKFVGKHPVSGKNGTLLAMGNPDLGDRQYDLPFAEKEARAVAAIFPKSTLLLKQDASKKKLREYGSGFAYLHFATHGKFDADNPLGSALMLAGNSAKDETDRLTVGELYSMTLNADLVTLSACETGLGKVANGDDVVGLVRGFLYAGANQVVSTLWPIDDAATSSLMTSFYGNLKAGKKKAQALREAQLSLRKNYPAPIFWAAFQMTAGD